jgi:sulfatase maturation enzyme AslB (radical SAM superfamily)
MNLFPLRFTRTDDAGLLFADDAGGFFKADDHFLERYVHGTMTGYDFNFLAENGHAFGDKSDLDFASFAYRFAKRLHLPHQLNYVILVPTLRCNLSCGYCQVSRVNENAKGHDWDDETLEAVLAWLDRLETKDIKIEFQGGEPLLRLGALDRVRTFARARFATSSFVVCTNLQDVSTDA